MAGWKRSRVSRLRSEAFRSRSRTSRDAWATKLAMNGLCSTPVFRTVRVSPLFFPPCSIGGTTLTIRKFASRLYNTDELLRIGTMTAPVLAWIAGAMARRQNILISGGTSTGKTTLLNALAALIDRDDRIVIIEDTAELHLEQANVVRFEARREQINLPPVTIRDLVKATLRHRPDRILVGEVRGAEAFDLLQALNTGHSGTLTTIHANSAAQGDHSIDQLRPAIRSGTAIPGDSEQHRRFSEPVNPHRTPKWKARGGRGGRDRGIRSGSRSLRASDRIPDRLGAERDAKSMTGVWNANEWLPNISDPTSGRTTA